MNGNLEVDLIFEARFSLLEVPFTGFFCSEEGSSLGDRVELLDALVLVLQVPFQLELVLPHIEMGEIVGGRQLQTFSIGLARAFHHALLVLHLFWELLPSQSAVSFFRTAVSPNNLVFRFEGGHTMFFDLLVAFNSHRELAPVHFFEDVIGKIPLGEVTLVLVFLPLVVEGDALPQLFLKVRVEQLSFSIKDDKVVLVLLKEVYEILVTDLID
mmetsp:Transcript_23433/g.23074  ORF Transcript_23433/g.23074 Transcript_23433/m.23074 type:complete len:213 (+) Transcript_23433:120-758(+)